MEAKLQLHIKATYLLYCLHEVTYTYMRLHDSIRSLIMLKLSLLSSHTVRHEYSLVEQHLDSVEQLNKATCRVLSSQVAG